MTLWASFSCWDDTFFPQPSQAFTQDFYSFEGTTRRPIYVDGLVDRCWGPASLNLCADHSCILHLVHLYTLINQNIKNTCFTLCRFTSCRQKQLWPIEAETQDIWGLSCGLWHWDTGSGSLGWGLGLTRWLILFTAAVSGVSVAADRCISS